MKLRIAINPDPYVVQNVREALAENDGYCPCSIVKDEDTKCMCKDFREQNHTGFCHCGLYLKLGV